MHTTVHDALSSACLHTLLAQVVLHEGRILEKPENAEEAKEFLKGYAQSPVRTVAAVAVTNLRNGHQELAVDVTEVRGKVGGR